MQLPNLPQNESDDFFPRFGEDFDDDDRRSSSSSSDFDDSRRVRVGEPVRSDDLFRCPEFVLVSVTRSRLRAESSNCLISRR